MFRAYEQNPFQNLLPADWIRLRNLLTDRERCFPVFSAPLEAREKDSDCRRSPRHTFPRGQWSSEEVLALLKAGVIEPTIHETSCEDFYPACRLFHLRSSDAADNNPTLICTDYPGSIEQRVFPWIDEAELLFRHITDTSESPINSVLNMFCNAGAVAMSVARLWPDATIACADVNPRALQYTRFNSLLNDLGNRIDIFGTSGEPDPFRNVNTKFDLILATPPMALQPPGEEDVEYLHSSGGPKGYRFVRQLLQNCNDYLNPGGRLVFLSYGLGTKGSLSDEPIELIRILDEDLGHGTWRITPLPNEKIWRVGDEKRFTNPMPIQYMVSRLADPTYRANAQGSYANWEHWIEDDLIRNNGFTHLHYVIVDYFASA